MATEEARKQQRDLGSLAAACKALLVVANHHRFHSFVMPYNPQHSSDLTWFYSIDENLSSAERFHNKALPELLERLITYSQLSQDLYYLSLRNAVLEYKAGVTRRRLRLFISASKTHGIEVPSYIPWLLHYRSYTREELANLRRGSTWKWLDEELWVHDNSLYPGESKSFDVWLMQLLLFGLAPRLKKLLIDPDIAQDVFDMRYLPNMRLPSVVTMAVSQPVGPSRIIHPLTDFRTEGLLSRFPNLGTFQNHDSVLTADPVRRGPAESPPLFPTLRRLLLAGDQPGRLEHVTAILREFPQLEELHYHRREGVFPEGDPNFSNANVFNAVHHCLRKLTYSSTLVIQYPDPNHYSIKIHCYEESHFSDVPHFSAFAMLEELTIDQALLGRMSTIRDHVESPVGPRFPELAWKLPQSLRCLTVHFVYDWPQLASQLISIALAKTDGQFPLLRDIYVVLVRSWTFTFDYAWFPHIPLLPEQNLTRGTGEMLKQASIDLWTRSAAIGPPPGELEDYPREFVPPGNPIEFFVKRTPFREL